MKRNQLTSSFNVPFVADQVPVLDNAYMKNPIGMVIMTRLKELKRTQGWLAERCGVSDTAVHKWIHKGQISRENAAVCALALKVSIDQLLGHDGMDVAVPPDGQEQHPGLFLVYVDATEMALLTCYREATRMGKETIEAVAKQAPRDVILPQQKNEHH